MKDYNKREIKPGVLVAYNRSGEVRIGTVQKIRKAKHSHYSGNSSFRGPLIVTYTWHDVIYVYDKQSKKVSKVTSNKNLCVLPCQACLGEE